MENHAMIERPAINLSLKRPMRSLDSSASSRRLTSDMTKAACSLSGPLRGGRNHHRAWLIIRAINSSCSIYGAEDTLSREATFRGLPEDSKIYRQARQKPLGDIEFFKTNHTLKTMFRVGIRTNLFTVAAWSLERDPSYRSRNGLGASKPDQHA